MYYLINILDFDTFIYSCIQSKEMLLCVSFSFVAAHQLVHEPGYNNDFPNYNLVLKLT